MAYPKATRLIFLLGAATALIFSANATAQAPVPIVDGYVTKGFEGWTKLTNGIPASVSYVHRPNDRSLAGAFVWFESVPVHSAQAAFLTTAQTHGITGVRILASRRVERAVLLDSKGSGMTMIGEGTRKGQPVRIAAFIFFGSTNSAERLSGVHGFAAPILIFEQMGGWIVPASLWMNLDPRREVSNARAQGTAAPAVQTKRFADVANIWSQWALNTMKGLAQGNIAAMSSARQTIICAGDPSCRLVPVH